MLPNFKNNPLVSALVNLSTELLIGLDEHYQILFINQTGCRFFAKTESELNQSSIFNHIHFASKKGQDTFKGLLTKTFNHGLSPHGENVGVFEVLDSYRRTRMMQFHFTPIMNIGEAPTGIGISIKDISENLFLKYENDYLRHYDQLTALPSRQTFLEKLDMAIPKAEHSHTMCALLFLGLDGFNIINDAFGHRVGDELLKEVGKRILKVLNETDFLARHSGDEFVVLLENIKNTEEPGRVAKEIIFALSTPFEMNHFLQFIGVSVGISIYPKDVVDGHTFMQYAKLALVEAKKHGKGSFQYFNPSLHMMAQSKIRIANELRNAIKENQLTLHFHPQYNVLTNKIIGMEALLRWNHPTMGEVSPSLFIPVAEEMGIIYPLGRWVFSKACELFSKWRADGKTDIYLGINLSVKEFEREDFVDFILDSLQNYQLPASAIQLEITESIFVGETDKIVAKLNQLKSVGFIIVMDDFGTGYSCLSYLSDLPIDVVKIDRSFVQGLENSIEDRNQSIIRTIVDLAKNLKMDVIAEGVETVVQKDFLVSLGCAHQQGFLFSKPLPFQEASELLMPNQQENRKLG